MNHGHNAVLDVTVTGELKNSMDELYDKMGVFRGMVMDFKDLKKIVKSNVIDVLDHTTLNESLSTLNICVDSVLEKEITKLKQISQKSPTCEVTAQLIFYCVRSFINPIYCGNVRLDKIRLTETNDSWAEVSK